MMTHGTNGRSDDNPARPPSVAGSQSSSGSGSSKHVKCIGRYVLTGTTLGKGNFARVEAGVHTLTRAKVAVKIIETDKIKEDYVRRNLLREAQLMRRLRHPNIIRLYETMKTNNLYCLVTEVAEGGELLSHVRNDFKEKRLSEAAARPFIRQMVSAVYHLHSVGIVHRDLKMENILLDKKKRNIKIVDFGLSNAQKPGSLLQTHCGSPEYAAPELFIPGREYGQEVDVWSLGVNMYAMLVGKLPFRSPRQGTKKRQKLLEQISAGLTESHEKEMLHISVEARDLIGRFLSPDPRRRVQLGEAMTHPWVTKDGSQPLVPFKVTPPDPATQKAVFELMATVLEVSISDIRETVRRDRCDWLASIYNLITDQPEGRNILERLITDSPEDQLVDAAHYQGSMEHFRLSQGDALDQPPPPPPAEVTLIGPTAQGTRRYRHSLSTDPIDYESATLPITKKERKRHHSHETRPLGAPKHLHLNPVQPPPGYGRRASVANPYTSPEHHPQPQELSRIPRRLPITPREEPYQVPREPVRPHSRAESAPEPLPVPWRSFGPRNQLVHSPQTTSPQTSQVGSPMSSQAQSPNSSPPPKVRAKSPLGHVNRSTSPGFREPMVSPLTHILSSKSSGGSKQKGFLDPIRPRSVSIGNHRLSGSIDNNLHLKTSNHPTQSASGWRHRTQVAPVSNRRLSVDAQLGWASAAHFTTQKLAHTGKNPPADIQALMQQGSKLPSSPYSSVQDIPHMVYRTGQDGSMTELKPEMFKPSEPIMAEYQNGPSSPHVKSADNLKVDPISAQDLSVRSHNVQYRSMSAKLISRPYGGIQELSAAVNHMARFQNGRPMHHGRDFAEGDIPGEHRGSNKSPDTKTRKGGIFGKLGRRREKQSHPAQHVQPISGEL